MPGSLFVVATPIGNLEDLTFRALRTLKEVDLIAAEDTRRTSRLLAHYGVSKPLVSLHEHNEHRESPRLVARIAAGESVALVSDAGTPAISDPGTTLVRLCREAGLRVEAIPGPSAIVAALSVSGFPAVPFSFLGFPPVSGQARNQWFDSLAEMTGAIVFFEAPHRIRKTLHDLSALPERPITVHREISKIHSELVSWPSCRSIAASAIQERGEFVVVLGPSHAPESLQPDEHALLDVFNRLAGAPTLTPEQVVAASAAAFGLQAQKARTLIKKAKILVKRHTDSTP
ncbi:MAG: 16S rRNA (cytidine(1402)-2'-O)-methyltransferase [Acidobacteria bacterium]|nr:16S rRNA (cytidine(1402)-2'-O)-methyltransferase [Acidobacteriota bacterium]